MASTGAPAFTIVFQSTINKRNTLLKPGCDMLPTVDDVLFVAGDEGKFFEITKHFIIQ